MPKWDNFTREEIIQKYNEANSIKEFFQSMGYKVSTNLDGRTKQRFEQEYPELDLTKIKFTNLENLKGQQFGNLLVIDYNTSLSKEKGRSQWKCQCLRCGNIITCEAGNLKSGHTKSCGCIRGDSQREDLIGLVFGSLQVISFNKEESQKKQKTIWNCKCDCGKMITVPAGNLKTGNTKSCGCQKKSKGEEAIAFLLTQMKENFISQQSFSDLIGDSRHLKFDFYLPDKRICIEYQGEQHYLPNDYFGGEEQLKIQQRYDQKKKEYCANNGILLIEIPYTDFKKLSIEYLEEKMDF